MIRTHILIPPKYFWNRFYHSQWTQKVATAIRPWRLWTTSWSRRTRTFWSSLTTTPCCLWPGWHLFSPATLGRILLFCWDKGRLIWISLRVLSPEYSDTHSSNLACLKCRSSQVWLHGRHWARIQLRHRRRRNDHEQSRRIQPLHLRLPQRKHSWRHAPWHVCKVAR